MKTVEFPKRTVESDLISFLLDAWEQSDRLVEHLLQILHSEVDWETKLREVAANQAASHDKFLAVRKAAREVLAARMPYSAFEEVAAEITMVKK